MVFICTYNVHLYMWCSFVHMVVICFCSAGDLRQGLVCAEQLYIISAVFLALPVLTCRES